MDTPNIHRRAPNHRKIKIKKTGYSIGEKIQHVAETAEQRQEWFAWVRSPWGFDWHSRTWMWNAECTCTHSYFYYTFLSASGEVFHFLCQHWALWKDKNFFSKYVFYLKCNKILHNACPTMHCICLVIMIVQLTQCCIMHSSWVFWKEAGDETIVNY